MTPPTESDLRAKIASNPRDAASLSRLAELLINQERFEEALALFHSMTRLGESGAAAYQACLLHFLRGEIKEALQYWDTRWQHSGVVPTEWPFPRWKGQNLGEKQLLVWGEQGVGDEIMFASMLPALKESGIPFILQCTGRMMPLFSRSFGVSCYPESATDALRGRTDIGAQLPMGDLMYFFSPQRNYPVRSGFITPDADRVAHFKQKYAAADQRPKVGLSWYSMNTDTGGLRTVTLEDMLPIIRNPNVQCISVQYGDMREYVAAVNARHGTNVWVDAEVDAFKDMDAFAAQVASLDLVISIANSTVHVAGSMGIPTWAMIPRIPSWRWQFSGEENYWYDHLRLFRQSSKTNWQDVIDAMAAALRHKNFT